MFKGLSPSLGEELSRSHGRRVSDLGTVPASGVPLVPLGAG